MKTKAKLFILAWFTLASFLFQSCEYPEIEIGQYDVELARRFIVERYGYNYLGQRAYAGTDTVIVGPTCLIGCYDLDSATAIANLPYRYLVDSNYIDTCIVFTYAIPK